MRKAAPPSVLSTHAIVPPYGCTIRRQNAWSLRYKDTSGRMVERRVSTEDSGALRTRTWIVDDAAFDGDGMANDLWRVAESGDITVSFVRIVKLDLPSADIR